MSARPLAVAQLRQVPLRSFALHSSQSFPSGRVDVEPPTRLVYFPDENHWVLKPQNSRLWHREFLAWIDKYIGSGPTK